MFGFVVSVGLFVILWLFGSYLKSQQIEDKKEGQVTSKRDTLSSIDAQYQSPEEKNIEEKGENDTEERASHQIDGDVERRKAGKSETEEDEKMEDDNIKQLREKNVENAFEKRQQKGTLRQLRAPEFEENSSVEQNEQNESERNGEDHTGKEIKCVDGADSEIMKYSKEAEGTLQTAGGIEITDVTDQDDVTDNKAGNGTSRIKIVEMEEEETECEVENREMKFLIKRSGETSEIFRVSDSSSSFSEIGHEYDIKTYGGEIPIVNVEAAEGEETGTVTSVWKESNEQSVISNISDNFNKPEGTIEVSDKASMMTFQNATSKTDQNFETEIKTNADGSTTRIKKITNVSVSRQEFRTQKVEVKSSCSSKLIGTSSGSIQELLQGQGIKLDGIQLDPSLGLSMGETLSLMPSEEMKHTEEGAEVTNFSKKPPFGGVQMFGGEELLAKIKKRRVEIDASESEKETEQATETEGGQIKPEAALKENSIPENLDPSELPLTKSDAGHDEDAALTSTTDGVPSSSSPESQDAPASHPPESDQAYEIDLDIPISECESLTHLNKSRPKGPTKRKPSFNSPKPEE